MQHVLTFCNLGIIDVVEGLREMGPYDIKTVELKSRVRVDP